MPVFLLNTWDAGDFVGYKLLTFIKYWIMRPKRLKLFTIFLLLLPLFVAMLGAGCEKNERDPLCYQGKVVILNKGWGCYNIIEIVKTINNGELPVGATITFDPELFGRKLDIGSKVYFKIIEYEKWDGFVYDRCISPGYIAIIESCNN